MSPVKLGHVLSVHFSSLRKNVRRARDFCTHEIGTVHVHVYSSKSVAHDPTAAAALSASMVHRARRGRRGHRATAAAAAADAAPPAAHQRRPQPRLLLLMLLLLLLECSAGSTRTARARADESPNASTTMSDVSDTLECGGNRSKNLRMSKHRHKSRKRGSWNRGKRPTRAGKHKSRETQGTK